MPTIVGILTFISKINYRVWQYENEISTNFGYFSNYEHLKFHAQLLELERRFISSGPGVKVIKLFSSFITRGQGYKTVFMLNSAESEIYPAHKLLDLVLITRNFN